MTDYQIDMDSIRRAMEEPPLVDPTTSPEVKVDLALRAVEAAIDDLIILANIEETRGLVCREKTALGNMLTRCETLCSFALAVKPGPMLVRRAV